MRMIKIYKIIERSNLTLHLTDKEIHVLCEQLQGVLSAKRYKHSLGVADTARELALQYGADPGQAYLAGLVHDYAKNMKKSDLIAIAQREHLITDPVELELTEVLHAPVGAYLLPRETQINDPEILQAVARHTLGDLNMTLLDKIIFVADIVEPNRNTPHLEKERKIAFENLDKAVLRSLESTICYCIEIGRKIHPKSVMLRNHYISMLKPDKEQK